MRNELIEQFSDNFMLLMPLLQRKIFDAVAVEECPPVRLSPMAARLLILLHEVRRCIVSDLSEQLNITRSNISPLLDKLVKKGLVSRHSCENDRRLVFVEITEQGDWLCNEYQRIISNKIKEMVSFLDVTDLSELNVHMDKLKSILIKTSNRQP
ncbi:MarR family winged helix-turn-helix transcriptional regulator [Paenibacillus eucommiae]|uniref:DNA-binding MarR family transcriptional regulator n=1 Tax=Paenibacillus eucommiae TaxID=1355755 RepID=A0ABS4JBJ7_9BACL|nr:MarR family transcriptional regulator [Paenibacillus eucommiae]MBP1996595.1 DNA-binding MarR family transcriptional regulator [Paenibacillus eucommiae]